MVKNSDPASSRMRSRLYATTLGLSSRPPDGGATGFLPVLFFGIWSFDIFRVVRARSANLRGARIQSGRRGEDQGSVEGVQDFYQIVVCLYTRFNFANESRRLQPFDT